MLTADTTVVGVRDLAQPTSVSRSVTTDVSADSLLKWPRRGMGSPIVGLSRRFSLAIRSGMRNIMVAIVILDN